MTISSTHPPLSIIVIAYNEERYLPLTMASLSRQTGCEFEVIVVDRNSTDGTEAVARQYADTAISDMDEESHNVVKDKFVEMLDGAWLLLRSWRFYAGLAVLFAGIRLNFLSQAYLHAYISQGRTIPVLSDMILDNIPLWDIDYMYDIASLLSSVIFGIYVIHRRKYGEVPLYLLLCGTFHLVRGVFCHQIPWGEVLAGDHNHERRHEAAGERMTLREDGATPLG